jgi:bifunctional DNA-binding transcriptional regulator/antitoxin component of YhaV-PrlF toxin-antitoxin module
MESMESSNQLEKQKKMFRRVQDIGHGQSYGIILPKQYAINLGIGGGDFVRMCQEENRIIIEKA